MWLGLLRFYIIPFLIYLIPIAFVPFSIPIPDHQPNAPQISPYFVNILTR